MMKMRSIQGLCLLLFISGIVSIPLKSTRENNAWRLPTTVTPTHYQIALTFPETIFTESDSVQYDGEVVITIETNGEEFDNIYLHYEQDFITIKSIAADTKTDDVQHTVNSTTGIAELAIDSSDNPTTLTITYNASVSISDMYGLYKSSYTENDVTKYLLSTQFEENRARRMFPCFDEPSFKATFNLTVNLPSTSNALHVIFNTPQKSSNANPDGTISHVFETTPKMSTYLIALVISEFTSSSDDTDTEVDGITYGVWSRKSLESERGLAVEYAPQILSKLNEFTNLPYSNFITKMDEVAIPDFAAGAMENWGLVTYRESALLWDEDESLANRYQQRVITVISHEFAHMWFGDIVTTSWWSHIFLNEGFATYFEYYIPSLLKPDWELMKQFVVVEHQAALEADSSETSLPLESEVNTPAEMSAKFDTIGYSKGGSVLRMVRHFLGEDNYQKGLQNYLSTYQLQATTPENLWLAFDGIDIENSEIKNLTTIMANWVNKAGYPVVTVKLVDGGNYTFTQERFIITESETRADESSDWYVPISYTTSEEKDFETTTPDLWISKTSDGSILQGKESWIILNIQETGYYRVNYAKSLWEQLATALQKSDFDGIVELNRAQIVDDLFALARANYVDYSQLFNYTSFLSQETSYYTWYSAFSGYNFILTKVGLDSTLGKKVKNHISTLMATLFKSVSESNDDNQIYTYNRVQAYSWACKLGNEECIEYATENFTNYVEHDQTTDKNLRATIYCYGLRNSKDAATDWNYLWQKYTETEISADQNTFLSALGCTEDTSLLTSYLEKSLDKSSGIRQQDASTVFSAVYTSGTVGLETAYQFLKENYSKIQTAYGSWSAVGTIVRGIANYFTTQEQIDDLQKFVDETDDLGEELISAINDAIKKAKINVKWLSDHEDELNEILDDVDSTTESSTSTSESTSSTTTEEPSGANTKMATISLVFLTVLFNLYKFIL